jgi:hypothetical protein
MRSLIFLIIIGVALAASGLFAAYGQVDPCRALAVERARRAEHASGLPIADVVEPISRLQTSQLSTSECAGDLIRSWAERLSHELHRSLARSAHVAVFR